MKAAEPRWDEILATPGADSGPAPSPLAALIAPAALAFAFWWLGHPALAVAVIVAGATIAVLRAVSPRARRLLDRGMEAVGQFVGRVLSTVLLFFLEVLIIAPIALLIWVFRRDPLRHGPMKGRIGWRERPIDLVTFDRRPYADETRVAHSPAGRALRLVPRVAGWIVIALAVDLAIGAALVAISDGGPDRSGDPVEARIAAVTAGLPWWPAYRAELDAVQYEFVPFVMSRPVDFAGEHVNIVHGERLTYQASTAGPDDPMVAVFGGSTIWGEGQRDLHTVPSELARLAEADGINVRFENAAQRGDVSFAQTQRFERSLAHDPPDLALFVNGPDDVAVQHERRSSDPTHYGLAATESSLREDRRSLVERYRDTSAINGIAERVRSILAIHAASASPGVASITPQARDTIDIYGRSVALITILSEQHRVPVRHFWQPVEVARDDRSIYAEVTRALPEQVTDVTDAYDGASSPVYLDGVHTSEAGAALLAAAIYAQLRPDLLALQGGNGGPG